MVIASKEIENVLLDIYFREFGVNTDTPNYYRLKEKLFSLDQPHISRQVGRYPAWKRMGWFECVYKQYVFGYSWDGQTAIIEECYKTNGRNESKQNLHSFLLEQRLREYIKKQVRKVLMT